MTLTGGSRSSASERRRQLDGPVEGRRADRFRWADSLSTRLGKREKKERGLMQAERDRERSLGVDFRLFELMIFYLNL
jgi:hypothetical protein